MTELKKEGGESFRQGQRNKLPVTTSSVVTEAPRQILGLKNFGIFAVFLAFAFIVILTNHFPSALIGAVATFTFIKVFIDSKPRYFIRYNLEYLLRVPRILYHRPREKTPPFIEEDVQVGD